MKVSDRIKKMQFSPIRKLAPYSEEAESKGIKVYHLNIGQPDILTPDTFIDGIKNYKDKVLKYSSSAGINQLIESFIKYYKEWNLEFDKSEMLITNGGSEAILFAVMAIADEGDNILIPEPFYTNYNSFLELASVKVNPFMTKAEEGFHLPSMDAILSKINDRTRAILIANPGNPTGTVYTYDEIEMLCRIALEKNLYIISDEVYREFVYDNLKYTSPLFFDSVRDRIILIDSISKRYSACGARIGLLASKNREVINQALKICQSRLCVATIEQIAAANLINTDKEYFVKVKKEYENRRNIMYNGLKEIPGVICEKPAGAFYIVAKLPVKDAEDFSKWLLTDFSYNNETVMVAPAAGFYATKGLGEDEIRISYCLKEEDLKASVNLLKLGLEEYKKIK
ncbi:MAG: pyridoxal phosphate-dependent aminotransferase [Clostridiaceae bacterium]